MRAAKEKRKSVLKTKILIMFLTCAMLLSVIGIPSALATSEADECTMPDISEILSMRENLSDAEKKLSSNILQLTNDGFIPTGVDKDALITQMKEEKQIAEMPVKNGAGDSSAGLSVYVYIKVKNGSDLSKITPYIAKMENQNAEVGLAAAWVSIDDMKSLASMNEVVGIQEVTAPIVNAPIVNAGSVMSDGDEILNTDDVRSQFGVDGTGIKVGVISNGVDNWTTARDSGDLPADVTVVRNDIGGDIGTAMLEVVHDLAPGAKLYFHDNGTSQLDFIDAVDALVNEGCDIICDDVTWITAPFFEDGIIAQHIEDVIENEDINYITLAGDASTLHHQGLFYEDKEYPGWADLSHGKGNYKNMMATMRNGETIRAVLQWNDAFGRSKNNYDLIMYNRSTGDILAVSVNIQNGNDNPLEYIEYTSSTNSFRVGFAVYAHEGAAAKELEMYIYGNHVTYDTEINVMSDSIFGHAAIPDVLTCSAVAEWGMEEGPSRGPITMLSETRHKPDICGVEKVNVSGASGITNFEGTGAAVPHIAAVAALLECRFPTASSEQIRQMILDNAVDIMDARFDDKSGYGRADALAAASSHSNLSFDSQGGSDVDTQIVAAGGKAAAPRLPIKQNYVLEGWYKEPECTNVWSFGSQTVTEDTTLYAKWEDWVAKKDKIKSGKLSRTYYHTNGRINKIEEYYGANDSSGIKKIHYYTDGLRSSYRLFNESGDLVNLIDLYADGKTKKVNYYDTSTGIRDTYKLYDTDGRMTHFITCYGDGVKPQKTNYYNVETGVRTQYKLYDTAGRTTHLIDCHPGGVKPKKTNYYNVSTNIRTSYKLYDTQGRTTHYANCYSDGLKASKMNYYDVNTGKRSAYKTYRTDGTCSCHVVCDSNGNPSVATYYDEDGKVTKVVNY